jgi:hypothetical protein
MLAVATSLLGLALVICAAAALSWLRREGRLPPAWLAGAHGSAALAGLGFLVVALAGARRGEATGTQSFGIIAGVLLAAAALVGLAMLATHLLQRRVSGALVGIHATLAVAGFVILAVYAALG